MPDDTSKRSEHIPEKEHPLHKKNFEGGSKPEDHDRRTGRPRAAVRQDSDVLGDVSPRDETRS